ncbi:MAG: hypothetical protein WBG02_01520 [Candidatus Acidiferrum sp.]
MYKMLHRTVILLLAALVGLAASPLFAKAKARADASNPNAVVMTITATGKSKTQPPELAKSDVSFFQGRERSQIADLRRSDTLYLAVLIDDSLRSSVTQQWDDLRAFFMAQPQTTHIAVAYSRNGSAMIAQDFTTDHALAAKALRMPLGNASVASSPYLAIQDWVKHWPVTGERSSIILLSSGVDFVRGGFAPVDPDLDPTIAYAQKQNVNIWSIYVPDVGRSGHGVGGFNWESNLERVSQETGGQSYFIGLGMPVTLKPFFDQIQRNLNNQYLLAFAGNGGQKGKFQTVKVTTELHNVGLLSASQVFLPPVQ